MRKNINLFTRKTPKTTMSVKVVRS